MNLKKPGEDNSLAFIDVSQGNFRDQVDCVADELRQLAGNAEFKIDPLSAPYVLFVNGYTGSDAFVGGLYQNTEADIERRISNQKLECGYSEARPFKTINRAAIEAAIITSRDFFSTDAQKNRALVSIVVAPGEYMAMNGEGLVDNGTNFPARGDGFVPSDNELTAFNDDQTGGIILPRGCSLVSLDLRKTVIRPESVPVRADEAADYSNRRAIFKVTGTGYYYGFTFKDNENIQASHHLLSCFEFTPKAQLDTFYSKIIKSFASAQLSVGNTTAQDKETTIVAPKPDLPIEPTDGVVSASPYIYNTSIRSIYGLCGVFANGAVADGFKSMVIAQFTGVSLQKDLNCWQLYQGGNWNTNPTSYTQYINSDPNNTRMDPKQRSFHIRAVNDSIIQEVSVFAIGQGVHHWTETGGELTITNSNSNFGGCSGLSEGYKAKAAPQDGPYTILQIKRSINPLTKSNNIKQIRLGVLASTQANDSSTLEFENKLDPSNVDRNQPDILFRDNYTLKEDDYVFIENPSGPDYRAPLAANPYSGDNPTQIRFKGPFTTDDADENRAPGASEDEDLENSANDLPSLAGLVAYVRRLQDVRSVEERRTAIVVNFGSDNRLPPRDYVLRETGINPNDPESNDIDNNARRAAIAASGIFKGNNNANEALLELRAAQRRAEETDYNPELFYRPGDVVRERNKHFIARRNTTGIFDEDAFEENYVHMEELYAPAGFFKNAQPIIIFDRDTDESEESTRLGNTLLDVTPQYRSATDYQGVQELLQSFGIDLTIVNDVLTPVNPDNQEEFEDVSNIVNGSGNQIPLPTIESRRPSVVRMFGQAYEWAGFLNYSKALPNYQQVLSPSNKFTYYFTSNAGGIVYANGFNEEGLAVSPRGLEDVNTGEFLPLEEVGNPDRSFELPKELGNVTVANIEITGTIDAPEARTDLLGPVQLASRQDILGPNGSMVASRNTDISGLEVMTLKSTNLWAQQQGFVTQRKGVQKIYVDPINGKNRSGRQLEQNPPTEPKEACKSIFAAANYINTTFSPAETVQLLLGPGVYEESGNIELRPIMKVQSFSFERNANLCDNRDSDRGGDSTTPGGIKTGQKPFMGQGPVLNRRAKLWDQSRDYISNPNNHPVFPTRVSFSTRNRSDKLNISPLRFTFLSSGEVTGIVWWGLASTLLNVDPNTGDFYVSNSFFPDGITTQFRNSVLSDSNARANALSRYIRQIGEDQGVNQWNSLEVRECIVGEARLDINNCAFEAIGPTYDRATGNRSLRCLISCQNEVANIRGIWLVGNVKIDSNLINIAFGGSNNYFFTGHHNYMVGVERDGRILTLNFGGNDLELPGAQALNDYNLTFNNFHFVDDSLSYRGNNISDNSLVNQPLLADDVNLKDGSNILEEPASFGALIARTSFLNQGSANWRSFGDVVAEGRQGVVGCVGRYNEQPSSSTPQPKTLTKGINQIPNGCRITNTQEDYFIAARTGNKASPKEFNGPGSVTEDIDFTSINISSTCVQVGIDVNTAITSTANTTI